MDFTFTKSIRNSHCLFVSLSKYIKYVTVGLRVYINVIAGLL